MAASLQQSKIATTRTPALGGSFRTQNPGRVQGARNVTVNASDRPVWYPGNAPPAWLDGSLPGDYGYDPLGISSDPDVKAFMVQAELMNGRWAMMGCAGVLIPGVATKTGALNVPEWYEAGKVAMENSSIPLGALIVTELILFGWVETKRWYDFKNPGSQGDGSMMGFTDAFAGSGTPGYPGGRFFDPFGLAKGDPAKLEEYKVKEIKNGRLAMFSFAGYIAQYAATGKGPVDNWFDHIADPFHTTFTTNGVSVPFLG